MPSINHYSGRNSISNVTPVIEEASTADLTPDKPMTLDSVFPKASLPETRYNMSFLRRSKEPFKEFNIGLSSLQRRSGLTANDRLSSEHHIAPEFKEPILDGLERSDKSRPKFRINPALLTNDSGVYQRLSAALRVALPQSGLSIKDMLSSESYTPPKITEDILGDSDKTGTDIIEPNTRLT